MSSTSRFLLEPAPGGSSWCRTWSTPAPSRRTASGTCSARWRTRSAGTTEPCATWKEHSAATGGVGRITSVDLSACDGCAVTSSEHLLGEGVPRPVPTDAGGRRRPGAVRLQPTGTGVRWLASAVWGEVLLAQRDGRWDRLKVCRNPLCPCAFYDRSRNNSRVWHDVRTCGNVANLRASRARRRAAADLSGRRPARIGVRRGRSACRGCSRASPPSARSSPSGCSWPSSACWT